MWRGEGAWGWRRVVSAGVTVRCDWQGRSGAGSSGGLVRHELALVLESLLSMGSGGVVTVSRVEPLHGQRS